MKNVFFIQRAAIDVLLLNKATAIEICAYLVICKNTDRHGYESLVGYRTIKERLGIGQKKAGEAIRRLLSMECNGQRLLHSKGDWLHKKTGSFPTDKDNVGWIRDWFESEYKHQVWLSNDLVGNNGDPERPLNYFIKGSCRDNHARLLLLLYKYHNRQYSGVNYKFASITSQFDSNRRINGHVFYKSRLGEYHVSQNILDKFDLSIPFVESCNILDDLKKSGFINVSITVIGEHDGPDVPARKRRKSRLNKKIHGRTYSSNQLETWKAIKDLTIKFKDHNSTFTLSKLPVKNNSKAFAIGLRKIYKKSPLHNFSNLSFDKLSDLPGDFSESNSKFIYRLDYKSDNKRTIKLDDCLAGAIEDIAKKSGLEPASRKGKFYDAYWWINPGIAEIRLVGIMMPAHIPRTKLSACKEATLTFDALYSCDAYQLDVMDNYDAPSPFVDDNW